MGNDIISERIETGRHKYLSKIQGSLIGGAAGDALGYEVEFMSDAAIRARFGPDGITDYELSDGKALFWGSEGSRTGVADAALIPTPFC